MDTDDRWTTSLRHALTGAAAYGMLVQLGDELRDGWRDDT